MSLLGGLLDVVGAAIAIYSGGTLGVLAGALMGIGAAAQFGIIGGSVGSFMTSGAGAALIGVVGMGALAAGSLGTGSVSPASGSLSPARRNLVPLLPLVRMSAARQRLWIVTIFTRRWRSTMMLRAPSLPELPGFAYGGGA